MELQYNILYRSSGDISVDDIVCRKLVVTPCLTAAVRSTLELAVGGPLFRLPLRHSVQGRTSYTPL